MNIGSVSTARLLRPASFLPYLLLLGAAYSVFAETVDDPYITFRYAAHLLAGDGPVFNIGERVEGFTSPLHLLLSALLLRIAPSVDILFKAKCASLLFAFVILAQTKTLARRSGLRDWEVVLAQTLVALNINFALASVNALETTLYGSLLLASVLVFDRECQSGQGSVSGLLLFVATLARPEAALVLAALLIVRSLWMRRRQLPLRFVLDWLGMFAVPAAVLEIARWDYYGQLLPNTYFAKAQPLMTSLSTGLDYPLRALSPTPILIHTFFQQCLLLNPHNLLAFHSLVQKNLRFDLFNLFVPLLFWTLAILGLQRTRRHLFGRLSLAVLAAVLVFVFKSGGDWMYGWRFMVPVLPFLAVQQCHGIRAVSRWLVRHVQRVPSKQVFPLKNTAALCGMIVVLFWFVRLHQNKPLLMEECRFFDAGPEASSGQRGLWTAVGQRG